MSKLLMFSMLQVYGLEKLTSVEIEHAKELKTVKGALNASVKKWEKIVSLLEQHKYPNNLSESTCPLCKKFNNSSMPCGSNCFECPVYKKTHGKYCQKSPYEKYETLTNKIEINCIYNADDDEIIEYSVTYAVYERLIKYAKAEVEFLKSLTP